MNLRVLFEAGLILFLRLQLWVLLEFGSYLRASLFRGFTVFFKERRDVKTNKNVVYFGPFYEPTYIKAELILCIDDIKKYMYIP